MYSLNYNHIQYQINVINEELKYNDMKITAKWAREQADKVLGERVSKELEQCENAIKSAVNENKMSCSVTLYAHEKTIKELTEHGFEVKQHDGYDQRDPAYLTINW